MLPLLMLLLLLRQLLLHKSEQVLFFVVNRKCAVDRQWNLLARLKSLCQAAIKGSGFSYCCCCVG